MTPLSLFDVYFRFPHMGKELINWHGLAIKVPLKSAAADILKELNLLRSFHAFSSSLDINFFGHSDGGSYYGLGSVGERAKEFHIKL